MTQSQSKEQNKSLETDPKDMDVFELSDKEFKISTIKILNRLKKIIHGQNENINKEKENIEKEPKKFWM